MDTVVFSLGNSFLHCIPASPLKCGDSSRGSPTTFYDPHLAKFFVYNISCLVAVENRIEYDIGMDLGWVCPFEG